MAKEFRKGHPRETSKAARRPSILAAPSSIPAGKAPRRPIHSLLAALSSLLAGKAALLSLLAALSSLLIIAACAGRPVPTPAPPPTRTPPPPPAAAPANPTATPVSAPAPSPALAPTPVSAPDSSWKTLDALGSMSHITLGQHSICGLRSENAEGNAICVAWNHVRWGGDGPFTHIESGKEFQCGLRSDGEIVCWGLNIYGETDPPDGEFSALAAGKRHACALDLAGKAACWGWNRDGRADPPPDVTFATIAAGHSHSCGIAEFGNLVCWGSDSLGQSDPREGPFVSLALGRNHTCALRLSGEAVCQGDDSHGQSSPPASTAFSQISAGESQTCGVSQEGALECWGVEPLSRRSENYVAASVGYAETCARRADGYVECWGYAAQVETAQDRSVFLDGAEFDQPVEMFPWPHGGLAIVERRGYVKIHSAESAESRTALNFFNRVYCCVSERGMLSATLDPDFANHPFIYIYYQTDAKNRTLGEDSFFGNISRFPVVDDGEGGRINPDGELVIMELPQSKVHMGGALRFGPDGMLYASLGEDADCDAELRSRGACMDAQDLRTLSGKIIRIDVRGATETEPYRVPTDNPFLNSRNARPEIWASGMRNPFRISFDHEGNLIVADVGHIYFEELSIAYAGANLGWPRYEANLCRSESAALCAEVGGYAQPVYTYDHWQGNCAIIGGANLPGPNGEYVFGDYCSGRVWALEFDAQTGYSARELADIPRSITGFGTDADGALYALTQDGPIFPIDP